jgi:hypothetical protein
VGLLKQALTYDMDGYRRRIRLLRKLKGMNQTEWTAFTGIAYKKWNHYERGYPISREALWIIHDRLPGISTDWIWFGRMLGLAPDLKRRLERLEREDIKESLTKPRALKRKVKHRISKADTPRFNGS